MATLISSSLFPLFCLLVLTAAVEDAEFLASNQTRKLSNIENKTFFQSMEDASSPPIITSSSRTSKSDKYLLSWNAGSNVTSIRSYEVRYKKMSESKWFYKSIPPISSSLPLLDLEGSSLYEVEMVEVLKNNDVSQLAMSSFRTAKSSPSLKPFPSLTTDFPDVNENSKNPRRNNTGNKDAKSNVPGAPSTPFVSYVSPTSVSLTWNPRSNGGSPITGYKIQMRVVGGGKSRWVTKEKILSADTRNYDLTGLKRGAIYKFRVIAINGVGESPPSPDTAPHDTTSSARRSLTTSPQIVNIIIVNGSLYIQWEYEGVHPSEFEGFILTYTTTDSKRKRRKRLRNSSKMYYDLKGYKRGSLYSMRIQAYNSKGPSPFSDLAKFRVFHNKVRDDNEVEHVITREPTQPPHGRDYDDDNDNDDNPPSPNEKIRAQSSQRDTAFFIAGAALLFVIIILVSSGIIYHKNASIVRKAKKNGQAEIAPSNGQQETFCSKLSGQFCCSGSTTPSQCQQHPPTPPHCSCYSGSSSPPRMNGSCIQSNRTSVSHSVIPGNGMVQCPRIHSNPMYAVYYDYNSGRPPPCCTSAGIAPLWWVRGTDGEFCHIVPHTAKPRPKAGEEQAVKSIEDDPQGANAACSSTMVTRTYSGNVKDDGIDAGQIELTEISEGQSDSSEK